MKPSQWIRNLEVIDDLSMLKAINGLLETRAIRSREDLVGLLTAFQEDWFYKDTKASGEEISFSLTNNHVISLLSVDIKLRSLCKANGISNWNDCYYRTNLSISSGGDGIFPSSNIDTILATQLFVDYLRSQGVTHNYTCSMHPLRNPLVLVRDAMPKDVIDTYIPSLRPLLGDDIWDIVTVSFSTRLDQANHPN